MPGWVFLVEEKLKRFCDKLLYFRLLCLSLHTNRAYKANIISTIVDEVPLLRVGCMDYVICIISTIVDELPLLRVYLFYMAY